MKKTLSTYKNSTPVIRINGYEMKVDDIVLASLVGGLNLLLVSERGEGKTQILYDVLYGVFGGNGTYIRTSPDMEIKDVYTALNLEKLKNAKSSEDVIEVTKMAQKPFAAIDELNRAPPIVQNQLLNVLDGYIEVRGAKYHLGIPVGKKHYHVGIATINTGNKYFGTFDIDPAILDRFAIGLDLDYYPPKTSDLVEIIREEYGLREGNVKDRTNEIIEHWKKVKKQELPWETLITILYLREGVDYISSEPYSQRKTKGILPEGVHESGSIQNIMFPISIRTAKQIAYAYAAFTYVAKLHGFKDNEDYHLQNTLETLKLILPYSGCLKKEIVNSRYYGNPLLATEDVVKEIKENIESKQEDIARSLKIIKSGELTKEDLDVFGGEWKFMEDSLLKLKEEVFEKRKRRS